LFHMVQLYDCSGKNCLLNKRNYLNAMS
jgi:hypothetical protein